MLIKQCKFEGKILHMTAWKQMLESEELTFTKN